MRPPCRFCRCEEDYPCRLEAGEQCIYMTDRSHCTNPKCIVAADREKKKIRRETAERRREKVKPIREAWYAEFARRRKGPETARKRRRKTKGRAA